MNWFQPKNRGQVERPQTLASHTEQLDTKRITTRRGLPLADDHDKARGGSKHGYTAPDGRRCEFAPAGPPPLPSLVPGGAGDPTPPPAPARGDAPATGIIASDRGSESSPPLLIMAAESDWVPAGRLRGPLRSVDMLAPVEKDARPRPMVPGEVPPTWPAAPAYPPPGLLPPLPPPFSYGESAKSTTLRVGLRRERERSRPMAKDESMRRTGDAPRELDESVPRMVARAGSSPGVGMGGIGSIRIAV